MNGPPRVFTSARGRTRAFLVAAAVTGAFVLGGSLVRRFVPELLDPRLLRAVIAGYGELGPVVFIGLQALQVVVAPIPGQVLGVVSGYLFGPVTGTVVSLVGATVGSTVAFVVARRFGRPFVEDVIDEGTLDRFDEFVRRHGVVALFVVFLLPGLPDDAICFVAGVSRIPIRRLVGVSVLGRAPGYFVVNLAGAGFAAARPAGSVAILGLWAGASLLVYWKHEAILRRLDSG